MILEKAKSINVVPMGKLVVIYGRSGSGKTWLGGTFPKPMVVLRIGDDGARTIAGVEGIDYVDIQTTDDLKTALKEAAQDTKYKTVFVDTFSLLVNEWKNENVTGKGKRMTQQLWGDIMTETEECIRLAHQASLNHWVVLSCHEATDNIDGMEDELLPSVRASVSKGARTYLEGMANFGIHTIKLKKETTDPKTGQTVTRIGFAAEIGPNPYYWTKIQADPALAVPRRVMNPTFTKLAPLFRA